MKNLMKILFVIFVTSDYTDTVCRWVTEISLDLDWLAPLNLPLGSEPASRESALRGQLATTTRTF